MKNIFITIFTFSICLFVNSQNDNELTPWKDATLKKAFKQGDQGTAIINIKVKGKNSADCKVKAEKTAVFCVLFEGYDANTEKNIPKGIPLTKETVYDNKIDFFNRFFQNDGKYKSYVTESNFHPTAIPEEKIDRKTVECNYVVTVRTKALYEYLSDPELAIIKPLISNEVPPATVVVIPYDKFLDDNNFKKEIDAGGYMTTTYDLVNGVKHDDIATSIEIISSLLTGEGTGLKKMEIFEAQGAIERKDALVEQEEGGRKQKVSPAERLKNTATWDYSVKVNVKVEEFGTNRKINVYLQIVDMFTNYSETAEPVILNLSSSGDIDLQIKRGLSAAIDELRLKIGKLYAAKISNGIEGKVGFYISSKSKSSFNFDTQITVGSSQVKLSDQVSRILKKLTSAKTPPQLEGMADPLRVNYKSVVIPFEVVTVDDEGEQYKDKNSFIILGTQIEEKIKKVLPDAKVYLSPTLGSLDVYIEMK